MAAGRLPQPGSEFGPCAVEKCGHIDCNQTRDMAMTRCKYCGKVIGYDRRFYAFPIAGKPGEGELTHALCYEDAVEKERMVDVLNAGAKKEGE